MTTDPISARTDKALEALGFADIRPGYRALLRRLKERDAAGFGDATRRYEQVLVPAIVDGGAEPAAAWLEYGAWLARRLGPGRLLRLDESGLAIDADLDADPEPIPGHVMLYLPEDSGASAIPLLQPADPSPSQQAALELLGR